MSQMENFTPPKLLIFDWDGTLCDSLWRITHCVQRAAEQIGLQPPTDGEARNIVGLGLKEAFAILFPGIDESYIVELGKAYSGFFLDGDLPQSSFYPHVMDGLVELRDAGYLMAVATGKRRVGLEKEFVTHDLKGFFHGSRCADETLSKPDPLMLNELLAEFDLSANQAVMVGDTTYDMAMAQQVNMPRLAMTYGAHEKARLEGFSPIACLDCFSKFVPMFK
jgi:phosphoglycolate phosphatase